MDSPRLKEYKKEMARCFSRAIRDTYISYWNAQRLSDEIYDLLRHAETEFLRDDNWNDLLQFTIAVYRRWSHTEMDDDGGTILIMETLAFLWEQLYFLAPKGDKQKLFHFLTQYGSKESIYNLEQNLWDFLDSHFTEKGWLPKKKAYWKKQKNCCRTYPMIRSIGWQGFTGNGCWKSTGRRKIQQKKSSCCGPC